MKTKRAARTKKPSRLAALTAQVAQDYAHVHSLRVASRRAVLLYERGHLDQEVAGLNAALSNARRRVSEIDAMVTGLEGVIAKR